ALLALGKMAFGQQQYGAAATFFQEATFSAAWFDHIDVMAEAFQWGTQTHLVARMPGAYGPLEAAVAWARRQRAPVLEATLIVCQAQQAAESNDAVLAASLADRARRAMTRTEMSKGAVGARLSYIMALAAFLSGNLAGGEAAWTDVLAYQTSANRTGSHRLFEIGLVDGMVTSGRVTARVANELYARVLREPTPTDWTTAPVETMATVLFAPERVYERWLNIALEREEIERAAEIADRIRRLRFYATLPMGGRVLALGWTLAAPPESLADSTLLIRQDLLTRYPKIADILRRSDALRDTLRSAPLGPSGAGEGAVAKPAKGWAELAALGQAQELLLRELALRREPADFVFPPPLDCKKLQERLPPRQAVLSFLLTSQNQLHGFLHSRAGSRHWIIDGVPQVGKAVADLLRQFGQFDRNTPVDLDVLASDDWHATAAAIWQHLISGAQFDSAGDVEELVIVPDRFLWYLPFEALPAKEEEAAPPLLSLVRVRYVPTVALAVPDQRPFSLAKSTVVVTGKMFTNDDMADAVSAADQLRKVLGEVTELKSLPAPGSLLSVMGQRTLVLHDAGDSGRTAYDWAPLQLDHDKPGNSLAGWMAMPWGAPEQLIIPAFHSGAESAAALRRGMNGDEIFLSACGLMAAGSRTVLLSRWRTGGRTAFDLTREFTQELPFVSAPNAWQRSVQLLWEKELQLDREPRVKAGNVDSSIKATHPFFWAGYVLVDSGVRPLSAEAESVAKEAVGKEAVGKEAVGKEAVGKEPTESRGSGV
ncbi:MAG: CHAT domain-containing protein, partial [Pirellulaceae bacterium]